MISILRFLACRPGAKLSATQYPESGQHRTGRTRADKDARSAAEAGARQASRTSPGCQANHDFHAPLPPSSGSTPPPPSLPGAGGPHLDWLSVVFLDLTLTLAVVPRHLAAACLAAHLAFIMAGGD